MASTQVVFIVTLFLYLLITRWRRKNEKSFIASEEPKQPEWRDYTPAELKEYNGSKNSLVFLAIKGTVYNVTMGSKFYGPQGPYSAFAGHDASRGLAKNSFDDEFIPDSDAEELDDCSDLNDEERQALNDWKAFFDQKYQAVGRLISPREARAAATISETEEKVAHN
ncbi:DNA damage response protein [Schizosaccharomyces pombe]|uniref:Cytochrome P450 regulator dap1 n=1 Tax=Schizosaccharomyces pombe (strain 972 / ATCC 24843) TaxID=284812 RepID=DAP1_SCHPO|nr:cytochrome P450 regulator Dap1 [Schizosaccharomyces pombe]O13995.1 RecName: Full=Cytochrome P450 regulator dap1 [Schizosaccharomyces pombe 972h-]CAB16199.1 cytochrome P450 regulator Dap1 [Schizosaccharomyces pombe]|eukprot:NP_594461.1 cytochrome P450 regulator Dap1 [Schizosaccharomyces pombe]